MQATIGSDLDEAVVALYKATRLAQKATKNDPLDLGLSRVLGSVKRLGPARPSVIAADTLVDLSTASRHVDALVRKGLVAKNADPNDARAALVEITPAGRATLRTLVQNRTSAIEPALVHWSPADRRQLVTLLARFADDLDAYLTQEDS